MAAKTTKAQFRGEAFEKGLDIAEIHQKWDADSEIRNRLRGGAMSLLHPKSGLTCDNSTCSLNKGLLTPILMGMSANPDRKLPGLNDLRHEMACCFRANNRVGKEVMEAVAGDATHLRKLLSHVKSKARRHEVEKPILTKRDQFRLKSGIKSGPKMGRKGHRGKRAGGKAKGPSKRRRGVLRASSRRSLGDEAENDDELVEEASMKASPKAKAKAKAKSKASPKAKSKAKAKASPKAAAKAKAKAKASPKASPKAKVKAKAKASPKASTGADDTTSPKEKTTKRGRRAPPPEDASVMSLEDGLWWYLSAETEDDLKQQLLPLMHKYHEKKLCPEFKKELKAATTESENFAFTMYWTRPAVGVQHKESGIEIGQISTAPKAQGSWATKMVAVTDGAAMLGSFIEGLLGDGYIENNPEAMTQSYDIYRMKEYIKAAVHSALEEFAEL
ncbi:unnamed protein product [Symbiodinium necroappetens]|uniref:Uncharacterized protein n=1 Tax=Symbiodinium necroappetens TaxID=1628268 RepID=A0A812Y4V6_9DINO|nr:unnamed protein product [Symbiodinium necroappetens]